MPRTLIALAATLVIGAWSTLGEPEKKVGLSVLYVGNTSTPRGKAYADFLGKRFRKVETAKRKGFEPRRAEAFDVVALDWSQQDRQEEERTSRISPRPVSPFGPKASWSKPTVLLGSAGLLLGEAWEIVGTIG